MLNKDFARYSKEEEEMELDAGESAAWLKCLLVDMLPPP